MRRIDGRLKLEKKNMQSSTKETIKHFAIIFLILFSIWTILGALIGPHANDGCDITCTY